MGMEFLPDHTCDKTLSQLIQEYIKPDDQKEFFIPTRRVFECMDTMIPRVIARMKKIDKSGRVNHKVVTECAIRLGWAKFENVPEFNDLVINRAAKSLQCTSAEEKRIYKNRNSHGVLEYLLRETSNPFKINVSERAFNWIALNAPVLKMSNYELAIFFLCIGLVYGVDESLYDEKSRTPAWEIDEMKRIINECVVHCRMIPKEIELFEYKQNIIGQRVF